MYACVDLNIMYACVYLNVMYACVYLSIMYACVYLNIMYLLVLLYCSQAKRTFIMTMVVGSSNAAAPRPMMSMCWYTGFSASLSGKETACEPVCTCSRSMFWYSRNIPDIVTFPGNRWALSAAVNKAKSADCGAVEQKQTTSVKWCTQALLLVVHSCVYGQGSYRRSTK
jgi:hypothetical protein